jgi:hypothetical protein
MGLSVTRDVEQLPASWTSGHDCFELVVVSHPSGLQVKLCTWLNAGPALQQRFVIDPMAEFEQWV